MKANEFVKLEGLQVFRYALAQLSFMPKMFLVVYQYECEFVHEIKTNHGNLVFSYEEVKRLVESHELVGRYGGLESSKLTVNYPNFLNDEDIKTTNHRLSKAIADVESCL